MGFLLPTALTLAALAIPIIIFYMLKLRRQPARVSSLMLWQQVLADRQANAPWQKLKRNLLLLLQLLILALLVMALARPYFIVAARVQGNVIILLDASASMQATDIKPTRFAAAQTAALDVISRLSANDTVSVITVQDIPQLLAATTTDRARLRQAIQAATVTNRTADWPAALTLALANAATMSDSSLVIISDGGGQLRDFNKMNGLELFKAIEFIPISGAANNQGLVAMSLRDGLNGSELFVRVLNASDKAATWVVDVDVNGQIFDARKVDLPPHGEASFTMSNFPLTARQIKAHLVGADDFAADDTAWVIRTAAPTQILIVGPGNLFLERALSLLPNIKVQQTLPDLPLPQTHFDIVIFDRTVPAALPPSQLFFIAPPKSTPLFEVSGAFSQTRVTRLERDHPLLTYIELKNLHFRQALALTNTAWARPLIETNVAPLLLAGQIEGRRVAILTFALGQSDWPLQIEFPIFMLNLTRWLVPGEILEQAQTRHAGQTFELPALIDTKSFMVRTPTQQEITFNSTSTTTLTFNQTEALGIYQLFTETTVMPLKEFAVNLLSTDESNLAPLQSDLISRLTHQAAPVANQPPLQGRWEWWWPLVAAGLGVLLLEWWIYWRQAQ